MLKTGDGRGRSCKSFNRAISNNFFWKLLLAICSIKQVVISGIFCNQTLICSHVISQCHARPLARPLARNLARLDRYRACMVTMMLNVAIFDTYYEWKRLAKIVIRNTLICYKFTTRDLSRELLRE